MNWRYRGDPSMWAWLLHRLTGVGIFLFLLVHIVDTALIGWGKEAYDTVIQIYHHPVFRLGEILLVGMVLFHALNGIRVTLLDFVPHMTLYNRQMLTGVIVAFFVSFIPSAVIMVGQMLGYEGVVSWDWRGWREWRAWLPAVIAAFSVLAVAFPSLRGERTTPPIGGVEFYGWLFIRISGILLFILVLGHLLVMHLLEGGVNRVNFDFVAQRFVTPFWRTYDLLMLILAMGHGVWGMRLILLDFLQEPTHRFWAVTTLYIVSGIILTLGVLILLTFQPPR